MLPAANQSAPALEQFEAILIKEPGRFRTLYGAGKAAQLAGRPRSVASTLARLCEQSDRPGRAKFVEAQKAVSPNKAAGDPATLKQQPIVTDPLG